MSHFISFFPALFALATNPPAVVRPCAIIVGAECLHLIAPLRDQLGDLDAVLANDDGASGASGSSSVASRSHEVQIGMSSSEDETERVLRGLGIGVGLSPAGRADGSDHVSYRQPSSSSGLPLSTSACAAPIPIWRFDGLVSPAFSSTAPPTHASSAHPSHHDAAAALAPAIPDADGFFPLDAHLAVSSDARPPRSVRAALQPSDLLFFVFTSGTTGAAPKAARIRHLRMLLAGPAFYVAHRMEPADRLYCPLPLYHSAAGMIAVSMAWYGGMAFITRSKFSASHFFADCARHRATCVQYIGEICRYVLATPPSPADRQHTVRKALGNGLRPEVWRAFQQRFGVAYVGEFYGSTEGNALLINNTNHAGACGYLPRLSYHVYPLRVVQFDAVDEVPRRSASTGRCEPCASGEVGELLGRIDARDATRQFDGYTSRAATLDKIVRDAFAPGDAWFRTGDLMRVDADRFVYFVDRIGDTFRWRGENVSTSEVADTLHAFGAGAGAGVGSTLGPGGVQEAVVYGVAVPPHEGRAGMACVVPTEPLHVAQPDLFPWAALYAHLDRALPRFALPLFVRLQEAGDVLVTATFKHRKLELVAAGFDPALVGAPVFMRDDRVRSFVPLDAARYAAVLDGTLKF